MLQKENKLETMLYLEGRRNSKKKKSEQKMRSNRERVEEREKKQDL